MLRPPTQTADEEEPLPLRGGTPYSQDTRRKAQWSFITGLEEGDAYVADQQEAGLHPSERTFCQWWRQFQERGHIRPFRRTGNRWASV